MPERRIEYERLEHKADTGFLVKAPSWQRLYTDAALALTDLRVRLDRITDAEKRTAQVVAEDKEGLMVKWLTEVLFLFEKDRFLAKRVVFTQFDGKSIGATFWGETYNPLRHGTVSEIKAVTYHQLQLGEIAGTEPQFFARVFLDL
jgi:SHS2 domain-containing protein